MISYAEYEHLDVKVANRVAPLTLNRPEVPKAMEIAHELANGATWAIRWTKLALNSIIKERANLVLPASYAYEHITMEMADHLEAAAAFKEKRKPVFQGR
jgi:enoyl-CoA hydratase